MQLNKTIKHPRGRYFATTFDLLKLLTQTMFNFKNSTRDERETLKKNLALAMSTNKDIHLMPSFRVGLFTSLKSITSRNKKNKVILTSITIPDTVNAIRLNNLDPIFCEMSSDNHSIATQELKQLVDDDTLAVVITHLSGCVTEEIEDIAKFLKEKNVLLIEDFSQAFGNENTIKHADISIGSFSTGKTISTLIGGVVITNHQELSKDLDNESFNLNNQQRRMILFQIVDSLKVNLLCNRYVFSFLTYYVLTVFKKMFPKHYGEIEQARTITRLINQDKLYENSFTKRQQFPNFFFFSLSNGQISFANRMLRSFEKGNIRRRNNFILLRQKIRFDIIPSGFDNNAFNTYYHIPIKTNGKKELIQNELFKLGVDISSYGLPMCHTYFSNNDFEEVKRIKNDTLFVPISEFNKESDIDYITKCINTVYEKVM